MNERVLGIGTHIMVMAIVISVILLFLGTIILVIIHVCITGRAFRRGLGNDDATVDRGSLGSSSMSRDDVEKLPCFDYKAKDISSSPVDCAVCLENFKAGEKCRLLPSCGHSFHAHCVDSWLLRTPICPICRANADSWKDGEESSSFRGFVIELGDSQTTTESGHLAEVGDDEQRDIERVESAHLGGIVIELVEGQRMESGQLGDVKDGERDNQTVENSSHLSAAAENESREIQIGIDGRV